MHKASEAWGVTFRALFLPLTYGEPVERSGSWLGFGLN